jgi:hypothetical protein
MVQAGQARLELAAWTSKQSSRPRLNMVQAGQARLELAAWTSKKSMPTRTEHGQNRQREAGWISKEIQLLKRPELDQY